MQIVIDIPEEVYKKAQETHDALCDHVWLGIKYGTPLPEHHGKLIDIGTIYKDRIDHDNPVIYLTVNGEYIEAVSIDYLESLPTIIDVESKDKKGEK